MVFVTLNWEGGGIFQREKKKGSGSDENVGYVCRGGSRDKSGRSTVGVPRLPTPPVLFIPSRTGDFIFHALVVPFNMKLHIWFFSLFPIDGGYSFCGQN